MTNSNHGKDLLSSTFIISKFLKNISSSFIINSLNLSHRDNFNIVSSEIFSVKSTTNCKLLSSETLHCTIDSNAFLPNPLVSISLENNSLSNFTSFQSFLNFLHVESEVFILFFVEIFSFKAVNRFFFS